MADDSLGTFQKLIDQLPGYIAYVNAATLRYEVVNKGYETIFGIPREHIVGAHVKDIIGEANFQFARKYIDEVRSGNPVTYENTFDTPSGKHWIQVNFSPLFDDDGNVTKIVLLNHDITERKRAESALRESEKKPSDIPWCAKKMGKMPWISSRKKPGRTAPWPE
jgi:PAS domain S-box-containing protein